MLTLGRRLQSNYFSPLASKISSVLESRRRTSSSRHDRRDDTQHSNRSGTSDRRPYETFALGKVDSTESGSQHGILKDPENQVRYIAKVRVGNGAHSEAHSFPRSSIRVDNDVTVRHYR